jgi:hypothetical protein
MHRSNYTEEVGIDSRTHVVPWPIAGTLLTLAAVMLWLGMRDMEARADRHHESARLSAAAEKAAQPSLARK